MPHKTASIFNPPSSPVKPSKLTACNMKFVICQSNRLWSIQIKASHKTTEQHSKPSNNIITFGCIAYSLQTLQITVTSVIISKPKKQYSIMPYILNRRPKPKPPQNNVMTINKALKAVNDTMDWTVLFIVLLLVMGCSLLPLGGTGACYQPFKNSEQRLLQISFISLQFSSEFST